MKQRVRDAAALDRLLPRFGIIHKRYEIDLDARADDAQSSTRDYVLAGGSLGNASRQTASKREISVMSVR